MPSIVRLAFRGEQLPFAIDVQFIQRNLECPPDQIALGRSDRRAADLRQGEYGGVNGLKRQIIAEDGVGGGNQRVGGRHEHLGRKGFEFASTRRGKR